MSCFPMMTEDEIEYICSLIPVEKYVQYFEKNPKDFAKVMPGFRAKSLRNQKRVSGVLFRHRNHPFISSFIEKQINRWIEEIQQEVLLIMDKGESKEVAWLQTLPFCFFADNISIFLKLIGEEQSEEYVSLLSQSIRKIKGLESQSKKNDKTLKDNKQQMVQLNGEIIRIQADLEESGKKLIECSVEIKTLKRTNANMEKQTEVICLKDQEIEGLKKKIQERDGAIMQMKEELSANSNNLQQLENKIREEIKKQNESNLIEQAASVKTRCPKDMDEFRDYLGYNLENVGIETSTEYYSLLKNYLCEILFTGKPVLISRNTGMLLMKCVSNSLVASPTVATLSFATDISVEAVHEFLSAKNRILCLDNFIGNFNETILSTICESHKNKIIFLTVTYDKTLQFVPDEFLKYCHYLNINRIESFNQGRELTEAPSSVEEFEASIPIISPDLLWSPLLKEILDEFGVCKSLTSYKSTLVSDEERLVCILVFDILPYCSDVLDIAPFTISERLNKYAGDSGRCFYKALFRRWFT